MQYLTYGLALNGLDLKKIYRYFCDLKNIEAQDYLLLINRCDYQWPGVPGTGEQYLRPEQNYNSYVVYTVDIVGYNLVIQNQTHSDVLSASLTFTKYADGNYTIVESV